MSALSDIGPATGEVRGVTSAGLAGRCGNALAVGAPVFGWGSALAGSVLAVSTRNGVADRPLRADSTLCALSSSCCAEAGA